MSGTPFSIRGSSIESLQPTSVPFLIVAERGDGLDALLALRCWMLNGRLDERWHFYLTTGGGEGQGDR